MSNPKTSTAKMSNEVLIRSKKTFPHIAETWAQGGSSNQAFHTNSAVIAFIPLNFV